MTTQTASAFHAPNSNTNVDFLVPYNAPSPSEPPTLSEHGFSSIVSTNHSLESRSSNNMIQPITVSPSSSPLPLGAQQHQQDNMKKRRKRIQAAAAVTGAVSGFVIAGPLGSVLLGCSSHLITKQVCKKRERRILDQQYDQAVSQGHSRDISRDAVFT